MVFGPCEHDVTLDTLNESNAQIWRIVSGGLDAKVPPTGVWRWVDVRDVAAAHVNAIEPSVKGNQRFLISGGEFSWQRVCCLFEVWVLMYRLWILRERSFLIRILRREILHMSCLLRDGLLMFRMQRNNWD